MSLLISRVVYLIISRGKGMRKMDVESLNTNKFEEWNEMMHVGGSFPPQRHTHSVVIKSGQIWILDGGAFYGSKHIWNHPATKRLIHSNEMNNKKDLNLKIPFFAWIVQHLLHVHYHSNIICLSVCYFWCFLSQCPISSLDISPPETIFTTCRKKHEDEKFDCFTSSRSLSRFTVDYVCERQKTRGESYPRTAAMEIGLYSQKYII